MPLATCLHRSSWADGHDRPCCLSTEESVSEKVNNCITWSTWPYSLQTQPTVFPYIFAQCSMDVYRDFCKSSSLHESCSVQLQWGKNKSTKSKPTGFVIHIDFAPVNILILCPAGFLWPGFHSFPSCSFLSFHSREHSIWSFSTCTSEMCERQLTVMLDWSGPCSALICLNCNLHLTQNYLQLHKDYYNPGGITLYKYKCGKPERF